MCLKCTARYLQHTGGKQTQNSAKLISNTSTYVIFRDGRSFNI